MKDIYKMNAEKFFGELNSQMAMKIARAVFEYKKLGYDNLREIVKSNAYDEFRIKPTEFLGWRSEYHTIKQLKYLAKIGYLFLSPDMGISLNEDFFPTNQKLPPTSFLKSV